MPLRFVTNDNIDRFAVMLERAADAKARSLYQRLLVAEEDRFAEAEYRIEATDRCLADVRAKINRQTKLMEEMRLGART
jgi:hypothetical protein